ncbi:MAG: hypothetical protein HY823_12620 [Acidobacteria bacterium]|nr:hypothetical protein [Acidobacteriota bacterium]
MALSPVWAMLAAHGQATLNRSRKEMGRSGAAILGLVVGVLFLAAVVPLIVGSSLLGWVVGGSLRKPQGVPALGGLLTLVSLGGGLAGGALGGSRTLAWESYKVFPLPLRALFVAELVAALGDPLPLLLALSSVFLILGVGLAEPSILPLLPFLALTTVLTLLLAQQWVGLLAAAAVKRLQVGLFILASLAWVTSVLMSGLPLAAKGSAGFLVPGQVDSLARLGRTLAGWLTWFPATQGAQSLVDALEGAWGTALLRQTYPLAFVALLAWGAARASLRSAEPGRLATAASRRGERLWSFRGPVAGVARLQWQSLLGSHIGKFGFLVPLMTLVILRGPLAGLRGQSLWAVPAAFLYLGLAGIQIQLNQFGLDGHGVKALLLLPIGSRQLLAGKCLGIAFYQGAQTLMLIVLLTALGGVDPRGLVAALPLAGCTFLVHVGCGAWTSAWIPRPMPRDSLKNSNLALPVILLGMGLASTAAAFFGGIFLILAWKLPGALLPVMTLLFGACLAGYLRLLPPAAAFLDSRREFIAQSLG